ncbi:MAG: hypothetical protein RR365_04200 [Bacteroides sp.]
MTGEVLERIGRLSTPGFFITAEFSQESADAPSDNLEAFIFQKLLSIQKGAAGRKFVYRQGEWRIILTFFPTDRVVEEKYALKNQCFKKQKKK